MNAKSDQVKGHVKEAAGIATGNEDLEAEGKTQRLAGEAQERIDHAKDSAEDLIDKTKDRLDATLDKAKNALHRK
jgi:uncharacterized protein YjbJ (UPF0337 family)